MILDLASNNVDDEVAVMFCNATLENLGLGDTNIREGGFGAFSRLLEEAPSVDWTYRSNHTLRALQLPNPAN